MSRSIKNEILRKIAPLAIVTVAGLSYALVDRIEPVSDTPPARSIANEMVSEAVAPEAKPVQATHGSIARGASFFVEMTRAGVSPVEIDRIVRATRKTFNFKRVRPGQMYTIYGSNPGMLDSLHFTIDSEHTLAVSRVDEGFDARVDTLPYTIEHFVTRGVIHSSIYNSLASNDADVELASHLAVIYQWDIDFFKDIRKGDKYSILYSEKVYADGTKVLGDVLAARVFTQGREHHAFRYASKDGRSAYYDAKGNSLQKSLMRAPLNYSRVSSSFTYRRRHPVTRQIKSHLGTDYAARTGTPIRSTGDGSVLVAGYHKGNGNYVKIKHNSRYTTYYLHMSKFARGIRKGARVRQGQVIGYVGSTGLATGPHLCYRVKVGNKFVNSRTIRLPSKEPVPTTETALYSITRDSYLVRLFESSLEEHTEAVARPRPPHQERMSEVF